MKDAILYLLRVRLDELARESGENTFDSIQYDEVNRLIDSIENK